MATRNNEFRKIYIIPMYTFYLRCAPIQPVCVWCKYLTGMLYASAYDWIPYKRIYWKRFHLIFPCFHHHYSRWCLWICWTCVLHQAHMSFIWQCNELQFTEIFTHKRNETYVFVCCYTHDWITFRSLLKKIDRHWSRQIVVHYGPKNK